MSKRLAKLAELRKRSTELMDKPEPTADEDKELNQISSMYAKLTKKNADNSYTYAYDDEPNVENVSEPQGASEGGISEKTPTTSSEPEAKTSETATDGVDKERSTLAEAQKAIQAEADRQTSSTTVRMRSEYGPMSNKSMFLDIAISKLSDYGKSAYKQAGWDKSYGTLEEAENRVRSFKDSKDRTRATNTSGDNATLTQMGDFVSAVWDMNAYVGLLTAGAVVSDLYTYRDLPLGQGGAIINVPRFKGTFKVRRFSRSICF